MKRSETFDKIIAQYYPHQVGASYSYSADAYLPALRPLYDLAIALNGGEAPIYTVAKLAMGIGHSLHYNLIGASEVVYEDGEIKLETSSKEGRKWRLNIDKFWNIKCWLEDFGELAPDNQVAIYKYLMQNLFAVGVAEEEYCPLVESIRMPLIPVVCEMNIVLGHSEVA